MFCIRSPPLNYATVYAWILLIPPLFADERVKTPSVGRFIKMLRRARIAGPDEWSEGRKYPMSSERVDIGKCSRKLSEKVETN